VLHLFCLLQHYTSQHFGKEVDVLICSNVPPLTFGCLIWEVMIVFDIAASYTGAGDGL